eukprot:493126_1
MKRDVHSIDELIEYKTFLLCKRYTSPFSNLCGILYCKHCCQLEEDELKKGKSLFTGYVVSMDTVGQRLYAITKYVKKHEKSPTHQHNAETNGQNKQSIRQIMKNLSQIHFPLSENF